MPTYSHHMAPELGSSFVFTYINVPNAPPNPPFCTPDRSPCVCRRLHTSGNVACSASTPRTWTLEGHQDCSVKKKKVSRSLSYGLPAIWPVGTYGSHHRRRRAGWAKRQKQPVTVRLASRFGPQLNWPNFLLLIVVIAGQKYLELLFDRSLGCFKRVVAHGPRVL